MLALNAKRTAYSIVLLAMLGVVALAIGPAKGVFAQESSPSSTDEPCEGISHAQGFLLEAAGLDGTATSTVEHLDALVEALDRVVELQAEGKPRQAFRIANGLVERILVMERKAAENDDSLLADLLGSAAKALDDCLDRPNPGTLPPRPKPEPRPEPLPHPVGHLAYSSKFLCGREVERDPMKTRQLGEQTFLHTEQECQTEINIHNYSGRPITFWVRASKANPMGAPVGRTSGPVETTLGAHQAMQVNCRNIARMLHGDVDHEVCAGKEKAPEVLESVLRLLSNSSTDATFTDAELGIEPIRRMINALDEAIALEQSGHLRAALKLERRIAKTLGRLAEHAEEQGHTRLAEHVSETQTLVLRCIDVLVHDIDSAADGASRLDNRDKLVDGFVAIQTRREIEVTGVYRSTSSSTGFGGGVGSGIDTGVVQIRPHQMPRQMGTETPTQLGDL